MKQKISRKILDKFKATLKYALPFCLTILIISLPFLVYDYQAYISRVFFNNAFFSPERLNWVTYHLGAGVRFTDPLILIGGPNIITLVINYLIAYYILLGISLLLIYISLIRFVYKRKKKNSSNAQFIKALYLSIFLILAVQLFYPRGAYKFYLILLAPFSSIFFDYKNLSLNNTSDNHLKIRYFVPLIISWSIFFCYRYAYFLIIILWVMFLIYMRRKYTFTDFTESK